VKQHEIDDVTRPMPAVEPVRPHVPQRGFGFMRGKAGPPLLVIFGVGIGLALSVFVRGLPVGSTFGPGAAGVGDEGTATVATEVKLEPLASGASGTDGKSYETEAISPAKDRLVIVAVANEVTGGDAHPKLSGNELDWVEIASEAEGKHRMTLFRAMGEPSSGAVTITFPEPQRNSVWSVSQFDGVDRSGSDGENAVVQSVTGKTSADQELEIALEPLGDKSNVAYGAFASTSTDGSGTGSGFTKIHEEGVETIRGLTEWSSDGATTVAASTTSDVAWSGIAVEIKAGTKRVQGLLADGGTAGSQGSSTEGQTIGGTQGANPNGPTDPNDPNDPNAGCTTNCSSGATPGVTSNSIKVAANIVTDGTGASFLGDAINGIRAVFNEANVDGIHGRKILLTYRNDSWSADTGLNYIQNYIAEDYFALAVNPSSEGLNLAVQNNTIDNAGIPVVGTDGMLISQYRWPANSSSPGAAKWVWPVAASTVSTMHIIGEYGKKHYGATSFGLVYDKKYRFGVEGKEAFENHLASLGVPKDNVYTLGIEPGKTSYNTEAQTFNATCGTDNAPKCDLVAMLLDPSTAITWIGSGATFGKKITNGPQTLFNRNFASQCVNKRKAIGKTCHDFIVWTGYNPPVPGYDDKPGVAKYVNDVRRVNGQADVQNSFTEGAYLGAKLFVEALKRAGPDLTREKLRATLDSMTYDASGLSKPLTWTSSNHFANQYMHAFRIAYTPAGFQDWADENTGWVKDSRVGRI
jgi:branched-chain amino acid transport system substrate-binding protein